MTWRAKLRWAPADNTGIGSEHLIGACHDLPLVGRQNLMRPTDTTCPSWDGKTSCGPPILMMQAS